MVVTLLIIAFFSVRSPYFFTLSNFLAMFHTMAPVVVAACGMALLVIGGKIDISIGSIALLATSTAVILMLDGGVPPVLALALALLVGIVLGALNGLIVTVLGINPLITTLGTMIGFRGVALQMTNAGTFPLPDSVRWIGNLTVGPVNLDVLIALAVVLAVHYIHRRTAFGRHMTAIGNGEETARRLGIRTNFVLFAGFALSGFLAAVGGAMSVLQVSLLSTSVGRGMEFSAVAVVIVGGISLFGGRGTVWPQLVLGAFVFQLIATGLTQIGADPYAYRVISGALIFVAMFADALKARRRRMRAIAPETLPELEQPGLQENASVQR
ncbi:ABC transporter permease [Rhizobium sp. CF142]|uniref:ABC transporter permease n=1 Tax=Rhizobium sp. CF142 TaxID=1144314 RepID=UPI0012F70613|nr:ABC transporter permease [Rhizobium sp. CF142]